jgi:hypothetical protein
MSRHVRIEILNPCSSPDPIGEMRLDLQPGRRNFLRHAAFEDSLIMGDLLLQPFLVSGRHVTRDDSTVRKQMSCGSTSPTTLRSELIVFLSWTTGPPTAKSAFW